jgi:hypothetical protein
MYTHSYKPHYNTHEGQNGEKVEGGRKGDEGGVGGGERERRLISIN